MTSAKRVGWAKEMYAGLDNLRRTYELHQTFFSLILDDMTLEDYYTRFCSVFEEFDLVDPVSIDISLLQKQHESMCVARFLSGLLPTLTLFVLSFFVLRSCPP